LVKNRKVSERHIPVHYLLFLQRKNSLEDQEDPRRSVHEQVEPAQGTDHEKTNPLYLPADWASTSRQ